MNATRGALVAVSLVAAASSAAVCAQDASVGHAATLAPAAATPVVLIPHRAIYDLSLAQSRENSSIVAVHGRILYDFSGSACDGYSLTFRQLSELDNSEGKVSTSDMRSTTWEGADAKSFKFNSENFVDQNLVDTVDGRAQRGAAKTAVDLRKPEQKILNLDPGVVFPTEHMVRAIEAARAGQSILTFPVYDGSETGQKVFNTLTVIGKKILPGEQQHDDAAAHEPKLANVPRWPVTISYFSDDKASQSGEQTPDYTIAFELYDNGISRALTLDYNDFVVSGKLVSLDIKTAKPCR
ncbi:MAG TPA: cell envelope integrity EipB family protein [Xanthobacteraceae bacterium]|nr:cell envelope integrity EipB family protein [Xanthobacteraceae bacterium]